MHCTMHSPRYLFRSEQRHGAETQIDDEGLENGQANCTISKGDKVAKGTRQQYKPSRGPYQDQKLGRCGLCHEQVRYKVTVRMRADEGRCCGIVDVQEADLCLAAEFIAASHTGLMLLGLRGFFGELDMKVVEPMPMCMDN